MSDHDMNDINNLLLGYHDVVLQHIQEQFSFSEKESKKYTQEVLKRAKRTLKHEIREPRENFDDWLQQALIKIANSVCNM